MVVKSKRIRAYLHSSLWFLPSLIIIASSGLALVLIYLDTQMSRDLQQRWPYLFGVSPEGSREMLATIAGSIITVAGVVFSITVLALAQASAQYTPRILRNFMGDRANQTALGVFAGIFSYCLIVLRTVRSDEAAFVPSLSVLTSFALALLGIAFLISFIHHVATSLQATHIIAAAATETLKAIDHIFPEDLGEGESEDNCEVDIGRVLRGNTWHSIPALSNGYIQNVDMERLLEYATRHDVVLCMERGIGDFAVAGAPLIWIASRLRPDDNAGAILNRLFTIDRHRTIEQDAPFGLRQLVDIALKALSPGVNDTTTAVTCIDYLTAVMAKLVRRRFPPSFRYNQHELRVIAVAPTFEQLWSLAFDQIRRNSRDNLAILWRLLRAFEVAGQVINSPGRRQTLCRHLTAYEESVRCIEPDSDRLRLERAYSSANAILTATDREQTPTPGSIADAA
jgi:uncharacterized membrane protein